MTRLSWSEENVEGEGLVGLAGVLVWGSKLVYAARVLRPATPDIVPDSKRYTQLRDKQPQRTATQSSLHLGTVCKQRSTEGKPADRSPTRPSTPSLPG